MGSAVSINSNESAQKRRFQRAGLIAIYGTSNRMKVNDKLLELPEFEMPLHRKESIFIHFRRTMMKQIPDIFLTSFMACMKTSSRFCSLVSLKDNSYNEIPCLTRHIENISNEQLAFYDKLIFVMKLDRDAVMEAVHSLAIIHFRYSKHMTIKPHLLEMWQQNLELLMSELEFEKESEKVIFLLSMSQLTTYIVTTLQVVGLQCRMELAQEQQQHENQKLSCPF